MPARMMLARVAALGEVAAYTCKEGELSGGELAARAKSLASYLRERNPKRSPVMLYGHKQRLMPICILGCMLAGVPYVPVDSDNPLSRATVIANLAGVVLVLAVEPINCGIPTIPAVEIDRITHIPSTGPLPTVQPDGLCYLLFTSGSSGVPKGVCITYGNLQSFLLFIDQLPAIEASQNGPILNHAQFGFDLSVADLHYGLWKGRSVYVLEKEVVQDFPALFHGLSISKATLAVMTPSFAQLCLLDKSMNSDLLPQLKTIFFCGESLLPHIVAELFRRFPGLRILNAYGPTETTVAVCAAEVTPDMTSWESVPIALGVPSCIRFAPQDAPEVFGEMMVIGPQVGAGYVGENQGGFCSDQGLPAFCTGDLAIYRDGYLFFIGRRDRQLKRGGHRIEPVDIEAALCTIEEVEKAAVLGVSRGQRVWIIAFVQGMVDQTLLHRRLVEQLPHYLLPDRVLFMDNIPLTANGKTDYKALERNIDLL